MVHNIEIIRQFEEKLDEFRGMDVSSVHHDLVAWLSAALTPPRQMVASGEPIPACRPGRWRDGDACEPAAPAPVASPDEARFRWLTDDLAGDEREARNRLLERMAVMSYSASCDAIDEAMRVEEESK